MEPYSNSAPAEPPAVLDAPLPDGRRLPMPARVAVIGSDGRAYAPHGAWLRSDDSFDRSVQSFETSYFDCEGNCTVELPVGKASIRAWHGLDYASTGSTWCASAAARAASRRGQLFA